MSCIETFYVSSTDGVEVAVHDFGGSGRALLFCHATGFCGHGWGPIIEMLRDRFHCLAVDFRAHGLTEQPSGATLAWSAMAEDLAAVVRHLSPGEPIWAVGHSMGATSIILAETREPGLFERAWAYEPILLPAGPVLLGDEAPDIANGARSRRPTFPSIQEAIDRYGSRPPLGLLDDRALRAYVEHGFRRLDDGSITLRCRPEQEAAVFEHHLCGSFELIAELDIPYVIAVGGPGEGPAQWVHDAAALYGDLTVVEYNDLSHFGPLQAPDRLATDIAGFFLG